ncbi:MAG TPA: ammonia channel protein, partial [Gammaproteobacteria bacterium]
GMLGTLSAGIFVAAGLGGAGLADGVGIGQQLGVQALGIAVTVGWTALVTFVILKIVGALVELRVSEEDETMGLDLTAHEESGYNL